MFDALDAETAVLAADGTIVAVNEAWEQFGRDNGALGTSVGISYPDGGLIAPGRFLPTAEAYGLAPAIDRWVIGRAFEVAAAGHAIELNLSAKSLTDPSLPLLIEQRLRLTNVATRPGSCSRSPRRP